MVLQTKIFFTPAISHFPSLTPNILKDKIKGKPFHLAGKNLFLCCDKFYGRVPKARPGAVT